MNTETPHSHELYTEEEREALDPLFLHWVDSLPEIKRTINRNGLSYELVEIDELGYEYMKDYAKDLCGNSYRYIILNLKSYFGVQCLYIAKRK